MEELEVALDRIDRTLQKGFAQLHQDLETLQRLVKENTKATYDAVSRD